MSFLFASCCCCCGVYLWFVFLSSKSIVQLTSSDGLFNFWKAFLFLAFLFRLCLDLSFCPAEEKALDVFQHNQINKIKFNLFPISTCNCTNMREFSFYEVCHSIFSVAQSFSKITYIFLHLSFFTFIHCSSSSAITFIQSEWQERKSYSYLQHAKYFWMNLINCRP